MSAPPAGFQHTLPSRPLTPASLPSQQQDKPAGTNVSCPETPNILDTLTLREATTVQERAACFRLGTTVGPAADFNAALQEHLSQLGPDRNNETRIWYLTLPEYATTVSEAPVDGSILAACKTVARDVLVCEDGVARQEKGYRLAAVVTHSQYRAFAGPIVATLLNRVMHWFDNPEGGNAGATFLYAPILNTGAAGGRVDGVSGGHVAGPGTPVEYLNTRGLLHKDARIAIATDHEHWGNQVSAQGEWIRTPGQASVPLQQQNEDTSQDAADLGEGVYRTYYLPGTVSPRNNNNSATSRQPQPTSQSQSQSQSQPQPNRQQPAQQRNLYAERGYTPIHGVQAVFWTASLEWAATSSTKRPLLPSSRPLTDLKEITALATQDVEQCIDFAVGFAKYLDGTHVAVLPTAGTVQAWMEQAVFTAAHGPSSSSSNVKRVAGDTGTLAPGEGGGGRGGGTAEKRQIQIFGAASNALNIWIYWYHDFSKSQLTVQRVFTPHVDDSAPGAHEAKAARTKALAQLLLDAMDEALRWGFSKVVVWEPDQRVETAAEVLGREMDIRVEFEERGGGRQTAVRLRGGGKGEVKMQLNEYFAWSG